MVYPHLGVWLEGVGQRPVRYVNHPAVLQRTLSPSQKLAESLGRGEETFMAGADERNGTLRVTSYRELGGIQRVVDRSDIQPADLLPLRERLFREESMLDFIASNWSAALDRGVRHPDDVLTDATRLFTSLGRSIPGPRSEVESGA